MARIFFFVLDICSAALKAASKGSPWMGPGSAPGCARDQRPLDPLSDAAAHPAGQGLGLLDRLAVFDRDLAADTLGKKPERFGLFAEPIERPGLWEDRELVERSAGVGAGNPCRVE